MKKVLIATQNKGKMREYEEMLKPLGFSLLSLKDVGFTGEVKETGITFKDNSYLKAKTIFDLFHLPVVADDSGLSVDALNGEPGVYSHRYAGLNASDSDNSDKLIHNLKVLNLPKYDAHFTCAITYIDQDQVIQKEGYLYGEIILEKRGNNGFGYDPIFYLPQFKKTVAELPDQEKNKISHRHDALMKLLEALK